MRGLIRTAGLALAIAALSGLIGVMPADAATGAVKITTRKLDNGTVGRPYSVDLAATGGRTPISWKLEAGGLPDGVTLTSTGLLAGRPTLSGKWNLTVAAADGSGHHAVKKLTLKITKALTIPTAGLPNASIGVPYSKALTAAGGTAPFQWKLTAGGLPDGLHLSVNGVITGTPTRAGKWKLTPAVTDALGNRTQRPLTLKVIGTNATGPGTISGRVTASNGGQGLNGVTVYVVGTDHFLDQIVTTAGNGTYFAAGLAPSRSGYSVCFAVPALDDMSAPLNYLDQCYRNVDWDGDSDNIPTNATPVPLTAGGRVSGINAELEPLGAISGRVTFHSKGVESVAVEAYLGGTSVSETTTTADGSYTLAQLAGSVTGYTVCFRADLLTLRFGVGVEANGKGYGDQCFSGVIWDSSGPPPAGATRVPVSAGRTVTSVDAALTTGSTLAGSVASDPGGRPIAGVAVYIFEDADRPDAFARTTSGADGRYSFTGLPPSPSGYAVCFDARSTPGPSVNGYLSQCYRLAAWSPDAPGSDFNTSAPAAGTALVPIRTTRSAVTGVNAALMEAGGISGRVIGGGAGGAEVYAAEGVEDQARSVAPSVTRTAIMGPVGRLRPA